MIHAKKIEFDSICSITDLTFGLATALSIKIKKPIRFNKKHETSTTPKKRKSLTSERILLIDDSIVCGISANETIEVKFIILNSFKFLSNFEYTFFKHLRNLGLNPKDLIILLDRQQGGLELIESNGIKVHRLLNKINNRSLKFYN